MGWLQKASFLLHHLLIAIPPSEHRIMSDLGSSSTSGLLSTWVGDHLVIPVAVGFSHIFGIALICCTNTVWGNRHLVLDSFELLCSFVCSIFFSSQSQGKLHHQSKTFMHIFFIARRGQVQELHSGNGLNYVGVRAEKGL